MIPHSSQKVGWYEFRSASDNIYYPIAAAVTKSSLYQSFAWAADNVASTVMIRLLAVRKQHLFSHRFARR